MKTRRWETAKYGRGLGRAIPPRPGLYVIGRAHRFGGLMLRFSPLYAGQSNNLQRRWNEHLDLTEPNPKLHGLHGGDLEFAWTLADPADLDRDEAHLIHQLAPPANRRIPPLATT